MMLPLKLKTDGSLGLISYKKNKPTVKSKDCIMFPTEYFKCSGQRKGIITKHWHIPESDCQINGVFNKRP